MAGEPGTDHFWRPDEQGMSQTGMHLQNLASIGLEGLVADIQRPKFRIERIRDDLFRNIDGWDSAHSHAVTSCKNASYKPVFIIEFCADDLCR
jgi:hypothetical protein